MTSSTHLNYAFASGMSANSDLLGAMRAKVPVGVVASHLTTLHSILSVPKYLNAGGVVFIDSGAFNAMRTGVPPVWKKIIQKYNDIAALTDATNNLYVVSPDVIGNQMGTLILLREHREALLGLITAGVNVIVPLQLGCLRPQDMLEAVISILGTNQFVAGIPSNRSAMSANDCAAITHHTSHILGRVQRDEDQKRRITALRLKNPDAVINADANWLRSHLKLVSSMTCSTVTEPYKHPRIEAVCRALKADNYRGLSASLRMS